jgi:hypothetical protein
MRSHGCISHLFQSIDAASNHIGVVSSHIGVRSKHIGVVSIYIGVVSIGSSTYRTRKRARYCRPDVLILISENAPGALLRLACAGVA